MSRVRVVVVVAGLVLLTESLALGQVDQRFDTTTPTSVVGSIVGLFMPVGAPSYLLIESKDEAGMSHRWALQGDHAGDLLRAGWTPRVRFGQVVTVTAFRLKSNVDAATITPTNIPDQVLAVTKTGRLLHGIEVTFADGRTLVFGSNK